MDDPSTLLSANLKRLREAAGLSQKALAEQSGVPRPTIAHLESGQANPTLSVAIKVAAALGVGVDGLIEPGPAPITVLGPRTLPTQRTSRVRRVQLSGAGQLRDPQFERVVIKAASRLRVAASEHAPALVICERGQFVLAAAQSEATLTAEFVAHVRVDCECATQEGGVLYIATSTARSQG